jgi:cell division protein FtsI (penicillin-binding protein 3)
VLSTDVAMRVRRMLEDVVTSGTATDADLATFTVAGKSGTARRTTGRRYGAGAYTASFVGLFPADDPQYVILVKLDNPSGAYFGGKTAAPVSKVVLEAAIAARDAALARQALASRKVEPTFEDTMRRVAGAARDPADADSSSLITITTSGGSAEVDTTNEQPDTLSGSVPYVVTLGVPTRTSAVAERARAVPDVRGLPLRAQVKALHAAGFRVQLAPPGAGGNLTTPAAGTPARAGSTVRLSIRAPGS